MKALDSLLAVYNIIRPILDVGIITFILYKTYEIIIRSNSIQIIKAAVIVLVAYAIGILFHLNTLIWLFNILAQALLIAFAIVFQPELRKLFLRLGQNQWFKIGERSRSTKIKGVLEAADNLSKLKRGMLVVFEKSPNPCDILISGTMLNADLSSALLVSIFQSDTPLHDGAVVIRGDKILAAACYLPLSEQYDIKKTFGTRHRAALGITEKSDAVVLVVSEETGAISLAFESKLYYDLSNTKLTQLLEKLLEISPESYSEEDS